MNLSHRQILVRGLFALALLAVGGLPGVSAQTQTTLPPCTAALNIPDDNDGIAQAMDIDKDGDGLIEICDLEGLDEIRHRLNGSGYRTTTEATVITTGCPDGGCTGYELTRHLNFMSASSYRLGSTNQIAWTSGNGWQPIGTSVQPFTATFDGNGYTISNLFINIGSGSIGLFGWIEEAKIANLGLLKVNVTGLRNVGGLAGTNIGSIANSYVTGSVTGRLSSIGGLVGVNFAFSSTFRGSIANSYATASVSGGAAMSGTGGLVGTNAAHAIITNSYATGSVSGTGQYIGGLVGRNAIQGNARSSITNSYATGMVTRTGSDVGGLVGLNEGTITNDDSYWLRQPDSASSGGTGVAASTSRTMTELQSPTTTSTEIYSSWLTADWDFRSPSQYPALRYAKGTDTENPTCSDTPPQTVSDQPQCGGLLANQEDHELPLCTFSLQIPDDDDGVLQDLDVDKDNDNLIEICDLEGLNEMRYQLDGMGYTATNGGTPITTGCATTCTGFELAKNLDFEEPADYRPGSTNQTAWTTRQGWEPIGVLSISNAFTAAFDGNGYTISNLRINRSEPGIGLFRAIVGNEIANLGLLNVNIAGQVVVGGLVGNNLGAIINSYVTGSVSGTSFSVGGLVGNNSSSSDVNGRIANSYTMASVSGTSDVGGLAGTNGTNQHRASITNSYATGMVTGTGTGARVGGLVGHNQSDSTITNSYATGMVRGTGTGARVGGLVGLNEGEITNDDSYWLSRPGISGGTGVAASTSRTAMQLTAPTTTAMTIYADWDPKVWDFGDDMQYPALKYATDCVEPGTAMSDAGQPICDTVLLNQEVDLQRGLPPCTMDIPDTDNDGIEQSDDVDKDGDGLIEICDLEGLNEMRFMLEGSGYRAAADAMIIADGCPSTSCTGFELTKSLDFMDDDSYREESINTAWTSGDGWQPIGVSGDAFLATFDGNGHTISNLMINRSGTDRIGLFGQARPPSGDDAPRPSIANLGLLNVNTTGSFYVGSLAGYVAGTMIINSYATGSVSGTDEFVGGLVGRSGFIMNSYAAVSVTAVNGNVGGLVGHNDFGTIISSYATGTVGGTGNNRGGLVGLNSGGNSIIEDSYATSRVEGTGNHIGGLVGRNNTTVEDSYWLRGSASNGGTGVNSNAEKTMTELQEPTTATGIYEDWLTADWDFGTSLQYPILKYAAGNLTGDLTGDLIPGQGVGLRSLQPLTDGAEFITTSGEATAFSEATTRHTIAVPPFMSRINLDLTAYNSDDNSNTTIEVVKEGEDDDFFVGMGGRGTASVSIATNPVLIITVTEPNQEPIVYRVVVTALPPCTFGIAVDDTDEVDQIIDIDKDGDGLIEICDLEGLDEMRLALDGSGYKADATATTNTTGCPSGGCNGYELANSLDFMDDDNYRNTANKGIYTVSNSNDNGWQPVGDDSNSFAAMFNGNGYTISNLMINRNSTRIGLFGATAASSAKIANLGLLDVDVRGNNFVGGLVGIGHGRITNSYVTGSVSGDDEVGGLVGSNSANITNSYATASVTGSGNDVGGLVGQNNNFIRNSYATGEVRGTGQGSTNVGGLVGWNDIGFISNSYATGIVSGSGASSNVGGLVGLNSNDIGITDSYWLVSSASSGGSGNATGTSRTAIQLASPTTTAMTYATWNADADVWDFGDDMKYPALKYAGDDCADPETTPVKSVTGPPICGTVLDNQEVDLTLLPPCTMNIPDTDNDSVEQTMDVDKDNDGLIEICDLDGLNEMRYQLDGMGYRAAAGADLIATGCPSTGCNGYELTRDIDFNDSNSYRPGSTNQAAWTSGEGWMPMGRSREASLIFNGNGYTISNLLINRPSDNAGVGFFQGFAGRIDEIRLEDVNVTGGQNTGGLAGWNLNTINNAYVSGRVTGMSISVGGLVGFNRDGNGIHHSVAVVTVSGPANRERVGGLVGYNARAITNSYAIAEVSGNTSVGGLAGWNEDFFAPVNTATIRNSFAIAKVSGSAQVGGLVGFVQSGRITDSYARGSVTATTTDDIGGLVGLLNQQVNAQSVNESYSIVEVAGNGARVGGLVGRRTHGDPVVVNNSYWDSQTSRQDTSDGGTSKTTIELQEPTTNEGIYASWSPDNWDFGTSLQLPILKATDSDTLLPGQGIGLRSLQTSTTGAELTPTFGATTRHTITIVPGMSSTELTLAAFGVATTRHTIIVPPGTSSIDLTLTAYSSTATIELFKEGGDIDYFAGKGSRGSVSVPIATSPVLVITVKEPDVEPIVYQVVVSAELPPCTLDILVNDDDNIDQIIDIDKDGDGLIEICDLEGLEETRHQLDGSGYKTTAGAIVITTGCPSSGCNGYELVNSLDFMADDSYRTTANKVTWTVADYGDPSDTGWQPIGDSLDGLSNSFAATFNGNGHTISNLMINRSGQNNIGLFGVASGDRIANLGLRNVDISGQNAVGGLVGNNLGAITNSYATGSVSGTSGVGGLVGQNFASRDFSGSITNSYATASVSGTSTNIGGLAGVNGNVTLRASIRNSYATGEVTGSGTATRVGGLVGWNLFPSSIANSYATGEVRGSGDSVGGLTGTNGGTIENSYWLDRPGLSRGDGVSAGTSRTAMQLTSPTTPTTMVYTGWIPSDWDFGTPNQYPALRYATGTDPDNPACSDTPPQTSSDQPQCETLLSDDQPVDASIRFRIKVFLEGPLQ